MARVQECSADTSEAWMSSNKDCACAYSICCWPYLYPNSFREYYEAFTFSICRWNFLSQLKRPWSYHSCFLPDVTMKYFHPISKLKHGKVSGYNSVLDFAAMLQFFRRCLSALQALTTMALLATGFVYGDSSVVALGCYPEIVLVYFNILTLLAIHPYICMSSFSLVTWRFWQHFLLFRYTEDDMGCLLCVWISMSWQTLGIL